MDKNKLLIVQISAYYPPHIGGMEIVAEEISRELARQKYFVTVLTSNIGAKKIKNNELILEVKRLSSFEIAHTPLMWTLPFRLLFLPKHSIIHIHISQAVIPELVFLISKLKGIKFIAHYHLDIGPSGAMGFLLPLYKKYFLGPVLRAANNVIVFSEEQASSVQKAYRIDKNKINIIPNGVGEQFFYREPRGIPKDKLQILYVGRLSAQKRVERIIEMMALLEIPASLTIVGDGEEREKLESLTKKLGLLDKIEFVGKKYDAELRAYYRRADVLVISSDIEGMPLVVLESMAMGLPIVGSNVAGIRELVSGVGILVGEPYPLMLAEALTKLWYNPQELSKLSMQSLMKAERYSWKKLISQLEIIYNTITT